MDNRGENLCLESKTLVRVKLPPPLVELTCLLVTTVKKYEAYKIGIRVERIDRKIRCKIEEVHQTAEVIIKLTF